MSRSRRYEVDEQVRFGHRGTAVLVVDAGGGLRSMPEISDSHAPGCFGRLARHVQRAGGDVARHDRHFIFL